ncbi:helix-turn-helix domain-containing protein [Mycobacterium sp. BMJ-28]
MPDLLTLVQAADVLQVNERTIRRYLSNGLLTGIRIGPRMIRIHRDSLIKLTRPVGAR